MLPSQRKLGSAGVPSYEAPKLRNHVWLLIRTSLKNIMMKTLSLGAIQASKEIAGFADLLEEMKMA
jgi:hypothetical protein